MLYDNKNRNSSDEVRQTTFQSASARSQNTFCKLHALHGES